MIDLNNLLNKVEQKKKEFVRNDRPVAPKPGATRVVILQGWNPACREVFWREFGAHYIKDASGKTVAFYPCDRVIYDKDCPVCAALQKASTNMFDDESLNLVKQMRSNTQYLMNVIVVGENENKPVVFALQKRAFTQLLTAIQSWGQAIFDETSPQVLEIRREGTGFDTNYTVTVTPEKFSLPANTYSQIKNLDEYVDQRTDSLATKAVTAIATTFGVSAAQIANQISAAPAASVAQVQYAPAQVAQPVPQPVAQPIAAPAVPVAQPVAPAPWEAQPVVAQPATMNPADYPTAGVAQPSPVAGAAPTIDTDIDALLASLES